MTVLALGGVVTLMAGEAPVGVSTASPAAPLFLPEGGSRSRGPG